MKAFARCRFVVVDVETTGTSHGHGDRVTEVAAVLIDDGVIREGFHSLVNPQRPIPWRVTELTGITNEMVAGAPVFADVAGKLAAVMRGRTFVAHNAPFDWGFLSMEFDQVGRPGAMAGTPLCTVRLARRLLAYLPRRNLDSVAQHYDVTIEGRHRALGDARATAQVLLRMLRELEHQGIYSLEELHEWLARRAYARPRRTAMPRWVDDRGLGT